MTEASIEFAFLPVELQNALLAVAKEHQRAKGLHPAEQASLHEGYAVLLEEVDEFWDVVKLKASKRPPGAAREELVQVAAMAVRTILEVC